MKYNCKSGANIYFQNLLADTMCQLMIFINLIDNFCNLPFLLWEFILKQALKYYKPVVYLEIISYVYLTSSLSLIIEKIFLA